MGLAKTFKGKQILIASLFLLVIVSLSFGIKNFNTGNELTGAISTDTDKITIVEYGDYLCPFCAKAEITLDELKNIYGDKVRIVYKHLPLHTGSFELAMAAECANDQGKFWAYHDYLYENQKTLSVNDIAKYAGNVGINIDEFNKCFNSGKTRDKVQNDLDDANELKKAGMIDKLATPIFFINGEKIVGAQSVEKFQEIIESKLA